MIKSDSETILVADDEEVIRDVVRSHLEKEGYKVITSQDGQEAIDALKEYNISVAITDLKMPRVDGFGVVEYIKKHCSFVPVIVLTGYVDIEIAVSAMKKGCFDYITKPIKREELMDVVRDALRKMRTYRSRRHFKIAEIYLLRDDGSIVFHEKTALHTKMDTEIFGYMLTVIKTLVKESCGSKNGMGGLAHPNIKVLLEEGNGYFLTVIGQGEDLEPVQEVMKSTVKNINRRYGDAITSFKDNFGEIGDFNKEFLDLKKIGENFEDSNLSNRKEGK